MGVLNMKTVFGFAHDLKRGKELVVALFKKSLLLLKLVLIFHLSFEKGFCVARNCIKCNKTL